MNRHCNNYPALKAYLDTLRQIPAGTFVMGSATGSADQRPKHSVRLSAFRIGATPVTVALWKEYCASAGVALPKTPEWGFLDDHPVVNVSIVDILGADGTGGFCAWASNLAGFPLTLPTEAQFEYAARGGRNGLTYPWGNRFDHTKLWCSLPSIRRQTAPVTRRSHVYRNAYGLTDMVGNVLQFCSNWYGPYSRGPQTDPLGPKSSTENLRVARGCSWGIDDPDVFQCALRFRSDPGSYSPHIGFRLVVAVKK
jgi:formylglycine-generating enzyme required for sulfatase activity